MAKQKLEASLGLDTKEYDAKLKGASQGMGSFGKELAVMAGAATAAAGAIGLMVDWFKKTEAGADTMNTALRVSGQLMNDLMLSGNVNLSHLREALSISEAENKIRIGDLHDNLVIANLERQTRDYRKEAYDTSKSLTERIEAQTKALEKQRELEKYKLADLQEELDAVERRLKLNPIETDALKERNRLQVEMINARDKESLRVISQLNSLKAEQTQRAKDLVDAFTPIPPVVESAAERAKRLADELERAKEAAGSIEKVYQGLPESFTESFTKKPVKGGGLARGGTDLAGPPQQIEQITQALTEQQEALLGLEDMFGSYFSNISDGFDALIGSMLDGLKRLIAEMAGRAVFFGLMKLLGVGIPGSFLQNILPGIIQPLVPATASGGGIGSSIGSERLVANIRGKDIQIALQRS